MKIPQSKELVIREEDHAIEYKEKEVQVRDKQETPLPSKKRQTNQNSRLAIYQNTLNRDEFRRTETKEIVLDEDEYLNYLEEIIQKDFFPELYEINKEKLIHNNLEKALSVTGNRVENSNVRENLIKINKEYFEDKKLDKIIKDEKTPKADLSNLNVDSFCMKYSCDELESLRDIFFKDKQKRLQKYFWMYEEEHRENEKLKALSEYSNNYLALPDPSKHYQESKIITANIDAKNSLFFAPDHSNTNNRMLKSKEDESIEQGLVNTFNLDEDKFSKNIIHDKVVIKENTRLPKNFIETLINKHSNKLRKKIYESYENSDVIKLLKELTEIDAKTREEKLASETPIINGYKLIKDPVPNPGEVDKDPIFTWGEMASTPNILERNEPNFVVPQTPDRESLAHSLTSKRINIKRQRDDFIKMTKNHNQTVRSNMKNYELTPNALKLLNTVKRNSTSRSIFDESDKGRTPILNRNKNHKMSDLRSVVSNISIKTTKK